MVVEQLDRLRGCWIAEGRLTAEPLGPAGEPEPDFARPRLWPVAGGPFAKNVPALLGSHPSKPYGQSGLFSILGVWSTITIARTRSGPNWSM